MGRPHPRRGPTDLSIIQSDGPASIDRGAFHPPRFAVGRSGGRRPQPAAQRGLTPVRSSTAYWAMPTDPAATTACLTLRRPLDGLVYRFRRLDPDTFAREDRPELTLRRHPTLGWSMHDPLSGELTGRPWDDAQRHAPVTPAPGVWVSRLGAKSHVYELTHGEPPPGGRERIRRAQPGDLAAIAAFDAFNGDRAAEVAAATCLVALDGTDQVVGYASWAPRGLLGQPFLQSLCVRPEARRQGLATALLQAVQQQARGRWLLSSTEDWCAPMQTLFERQGWERCGALLGINRDGSAEWFYRVALADPA